MIIIVILYIKKPWHKGLKTQVHTARRVEMVLKPRSAVSPSLSARLGHCPITVLVHTQHSVTVYGVIVAQKRTERLGWGCDSLRSFWVAELDGHVYRL